MLASPPVASKSLVVNVSAYGQAYLLTYPHVPANVYLWGVCPQANKGSCFDTLVQPRWFNINLFCNLVEFLSDILIGRQG